MYAIGVSGNEMTAAIAALFVKGCGSDIEDLASVRTPHSRLRALTSPRTVVIVYIIGRSLAGPNKLSGS